MKNVKILGFALAIFCGVFLFFYGGYDDSPGGQLLGIVFAAIGVIGIVRNRKKVPPQVI